jgi:hypothetical protein
MWPLAVLVAAVAVIAIGISLIDQPRTNTVVLPDEPQVGISHAIPRTFDYVDATTFPGAYGARVEAREATGPIESGYVAAADFPGAYGVPVEAREATAPIVSGYVTATDFPGPYGVPVAGAGAGIAGDGTFTPTMGSRPGMTGENICGQCLAD